MANRLRRILYLVRSTLRWLSNGRADKVPSNVSKVIVVPTGKLGDVVCVTPVLAAVRKYLPKAHLIVAGNANLHRPLLEGSGLADEYLDLGKAGALEQIKECQADAALVTGHHYEATALFYLAGIPLVVAPSVEGGTSEEETRPYKILKHFVKTFTIKIGEYAPRERLKVLEPLGIFTDDARKHLGFSSMGEEKAKELISKIQKPYQYLVGISAGAGNKEKQWDPKNFAKVANYLIENHRAHIVISGGKNDITESTEMASAIEDKSMITDTTNLISIDDLKALISKLDTFISVNTGPIYIAEAFDVPTVDLVGPVNAYDQPPQGKIHKVVFPPGKPKPLLNILNTRNHNIDEAVRIAESTRIEDVIAAVEEALKEKTKLK